MALELRESHDVSSELRDHGLERLMTGSATLLICIALHLSAAL